MDSSDTFTCCQYNAGNLVYRSVDPAGAPPATVEHYAVENGERTMTLQSDGDILRRYAYGSAGEVLFDQAFNSLGQETNALLPLGDHQNSTRVVLGAYNRAVHQSLDYAPFGRVTGVYDQNGLLVVDGQGGLSAIITAHGHHGSLLDVETGLQLKGARWYSPDLGRFLSEDPIGYAGGDSNLYRFAGK